MNTTASPGKSVSRKFSSLNCLLINQFATPGLGSLMARRFIAGSIQLTLAILGFLLFVAWFFLQMMVMYRMAAGAEDQPSHLSWLGWGGAAVFFVSWLLAWPTSISVLRENRKREAEARVGVGAPPVIQS